MTSLIFIRLWTWIDDRFDITYRPEKHFMRGPGPKTLRRLAREANAARPGAEDEAPARA